jgi:hypothetical protein
MGEHASTFFFSLTQRNLLLCQTESYLHGMTGFHLTCQSTQEKPEKTSHLFVAILIKV